MSEPLYPTPTFDDVNILRAKLAAAEKRAEEAERKNAQLVNYLGPLMIAATELLRHLPIVMRPEGKRATDDLRKMLGPKYDPTNGEAMSLTSQPSSARAEVERLKSQIASPLITYGFKCLGGCNCFDKAPTVPVFRHRWQHLDDCPAKASGFRVGEIEQRAAAPSPEAIRYCRVVETFEYEPIPSEHNGDKAYTTRQCGARLPCNRHSEQTPELCGFTFYVTVPPGITKPMSRCQNVMPCADHPQAAAAPSPEGKIGDKRRCHCGTTRIGLHGPDRCDTVT